MAVNWLLRTPAITSVLIGASKVSQIEDIVAGVSNTAFSDEELAAIDAALAS
jgi:L-glyceraldehyde 3-phosphate reductase